MGLKNIEKEYWNNELSKYKYRYKGLCLGKNSSYENRFITVYMEYEEEDDLISIENSIKNIIAYINKTPYKEGNFLESVEYDINDIDNRGFIDIKLSKKTTKDEFKSLLKVFDACF